MILNRFTLVEHTIRRFKNLIKRLLMAKQNTSQCSLQNTLLVDIQPYMVKRDGIDVDDADAFYLAFENTFRGSEAAVTKKQEKYLSYIKEAYKNGGSRHILLDIGCGRGEFLKLLKKVNVPAKGVEINSMVYRNLKAENIDVELIDANKYLENIGENSVFGISAFQIVEHLSQEYFKKFLRIAHEKIIPGGIIILETVNPKCSVALSNFYLDPTHVRPNHPELLKFLLEWYGFSQVKILFSQLCPENFWIEGAPQHAYMDYAVIGWKNG